MKARALLDWHLWTKCPYCGHDFDLSDHDNEGQERGLRIAAVVLKEAA
jgi:hypothetical protein